MRINNLLVGALAPLSGAFLFAPAQVAQGQTAAEATLEEIVVTARRREENLNDVPVAISVMSNDFLLEAGINDNFDLFDAAVGFEYDTGWGDRNTAQPAVRGVQGNGLGVNQQKVNSFLDGFPLLGQQGTMQFDDVQRVELYRGPQSAAFGRATFGGAINYVSRDPGDEFSTEFFVGSSDMGRDEIKISLDGPITDTLGFTLDLSSDEYEGPDEWDTSDGYHLGKTATDYGSVKFVYAPTESFTAKLRYIHLASDDSPGIRYFLPIEESQACSNLTLPPPRRALYYQGEIDCNFAAANGVQRNHDLTAGVDPSDPNYQLLLAHSVLGEPYAVDERDRIHVELDFAIGDGTLQVLAMTSDEFYETWQDSDGSSQPARIIGMNPNIPGAGTRIVGSASNMANPFDLTEEYLEVRWVSPGEERLRYLVGVSSYDAVADGQGIFNKAGIDLGLDGDLIQGSPFVARALFGDSAENLGVFANLSYDISDRTVFTAEGRYQVDTISAVNKLEDNKMLENETSAFLPRLSITHDLRDDLTFYGQLSQGNNPGGVGIGYTFDQTVEALAIANASGFVSYDAFTFREYVEEELTNLEVGLKGNLFDGQLAFAAALYTLEWENQTNLYTVNWNGPWNDPLDPAFNGVEYPVSEISERTTLNEGTIGITGVEFEGTYFINDAWSINGNLSVMDSQYDEFCDVLAVGGFAQEPVDGISPLTGVGCHVQTGNTPPNVSEVTYNLGFAYRAPLGNSNWRLAARMDLRHAGPQYLDRSNVMELGDRDLVNGSITVRNENWTVRLWGSNLTDDDMPRRVGLGIDGNAGRVPNFVVTPQRPREIGLSLAYRF